MTSARLTEFHRLCLTSSFVVLHLYTRLGFLDFFTLLVSYISRLLVVLFPLVAHWSLLASPNTLLSD